MKKVVQLTKKVIIDRELAESPLAMALKNMSPLEAKQWVQDNVTDLASAKDALEKMAMVLVWLTNNRK